MFKQFLPTGSARSSSPWVWHHLSATGCWTFQQTGPSLSEYEHGHEQSRESARNPTGLWAESTAILSVYLWLCGLPESCHRSLMTPQLLDWLQVERRRQTDNSWQSYFLVLKGHPHPKHHKSQEYDHGSQEKTEGEICPLKVGAIWVEEVKTFKFPDTHIREDLTRSYNCQQLLKTAQQRLFFLRKLRKFGISPKVLSSFYRDTDEGIIISTIIILCPFLTINTMFYDCCCMISCKWFYVSLFFFCKMRLPVSVRFTV